MKLKAAIVPAGQWGTALAVPLSGGGHSVRLYFRSQEDADRFNASCENAKRLPGVIFPNDVSATADLAEAVWDADLIVLAPASGGLRGLCRKLRPYVPEKAVVVSMVKALFADGPRLPSQVIAQRILYEGLSAKEGLRRLMARQPRPELDVNL